MTASHEATKGTKTHEGILTTSHEHRSHLAGRLRAPFVIFVPSCEAVPELSVGSGQDFWRLAWRPGVLRCSAPDHDLGHLGAEIPRSLTEPGSYRMTDFGIGLRRVMTIFSRSSTSAMRGAISLFHSSLW